MLIGASSTYNVKSTGGSTEVPYHTHGFTQPTLPNHTHGPASSGKVYIAGVWKTGVAGTVAAQSFSSGKALEVYGSYTTGNITSWGNTGNPTSLPSCTGGSVSYAGTSGNNNLPPYYAVYIWERTA